MLITTVALATDTAVTDKGNVVMQLPHSTSLFGFSTLSVTNLDQAPQLYLKFHSLVYISHGIQTSAVVHFHLLSNSWFTCCIQETQLSLRDRATRACQLKSG